MLIFKMLETDKLCSNFYVNFEIRIQNWKKIRIEIEYIKVVLSKKYDNVFASVLGEQFYRCSVSSMSRPWRRTRSSTAISRSAPGTIKICFKIWIFGASFKGVVNLPTASFPAFTVQITSQVSRYWLQVHEVAKSTTGAFSRNGRSIFN